ncbi:MAG: hypothetical protein ACRELC_01660, partial [Gemmatimonadota bacterium]
MSLADPRVARGGAARNAVLLLNFGEPETTDRASVIEFLARVFLANASLDGPADTAAAGARARQLA